MLQIAILAPNRLGFVLAFCFLSDLIPKYQADTLSKSSWLVIKTIEISILPFPFFFPFNTWLWWLTVAPNHYNSTGAFRVIFKVQLEGNNGNPWQCQCYRIACAWKYCACFVPGCQVVMLAILTNWKQVASSFRDPWVLFQQERAVF